MKPIHSNSAILNVAKGYLGVLIASILTGVVFLGLDEYHGIGLAIIVALWALPVFGVLLGLVFFVAGRKREGLISLMIGTLMVLPGFGFILAFSIRI